LLSANTNLICTSNGILQYNSLTNSFSILPIYYKGEFLYTKKSITIAYKDNQNTVYLVSNDGIFILNQQQSNIVLLRNYTSNHTTLPNDIRDFSEDSEHNIWMATTEGVIVYNPITEELKKINLQNEDYNNFKFSTIRQVLICNNKCYIGTAGNGVFVYDLKTKNIHKLIESSITNNIVYKKELSEAYVWKITLLQNKLLLIATGKACYTYNTNTKEIIQKKFITPSYNTRTFTQDSLGNIWYGTSQGLVVLDKDFNTKFYIKDSFPDKRIAAFCSISKTKMLVATNGLYEVELKTNTTFTITRLNEISSEKFIYCMQKDKEGNIWLGTDDGLIKYNYTTKKAWSFDASDNVQTQAFNSDGAFLHSSGMMYFGGKNGLNIFNPSLVSSRNIMLSPTLVRVAYGDTVLCNISPTQTISIPFSKNKIQLFITAPNFINPFNVKYKYKLNATDEWTFVGTQSQIYFASLPPGNYKINYAASVDEKNWFYASSPVLLSIKKPWWQSTIFLVLLALLFIGFALLINYWLNKLKEQKNIKLAIDYFSKSAFEQNTLNDILWDITSNCVARLGLEECVIYIANHDTKTLHQRAAYGNKNPTKFEIANPITIPFGKGIVGTVAVTGKAEIVNNTTKDKRYIIDDANRLSEITVPIIFENQVIGVIDSEHIKANFFKAKHLNALTTIASICSAKISSGIATEALQQATEKVNELNREIKEITFLNLRLQMNPHFLFNSLTSIQHLIISKQTNKAYKYLTIFSKFLRSILQFAEETLINLDDEIKLLNMYIALESLGFDESYSYSITINQEIEQEDVLIPPLLIQPFIENAIWHGLKNKEGEKKLSIHFDLLNEDTVCCTITDNGVGRKKAEEEKKNNLSENKHQSKAVSVTQKRLQLLQEKANKPAFLEYMNVTEGTVVKIYFPYFNK
jgi:sensor histidine kinase YesM